jgi:peroxiredoxin
MAGAKQRQMLGEGSRAPAFQLSGLDGSAPTLSDILARGPALLAFFKVSCPVCQYTFPFLERIHRGAGGERAGVQIFGVSQDQADATRDFNAEQGVTFPTLLDEAGKGYPASNAFGIQSVPTIFLVEPDGSISLSGTGFSKRDLEAIGARVGVAPFRAGERVPEQRPG